MRGQAHTLEGIGAALVVVLAVTFTLQATAVTPLTASTASQHIETQHERTASGLLDTARANDTISATLRYWNDSAGKFRNASDRGYYVGTTPDTAFVDSLQAAFADHAIVFNVNAYYVTPNGDRRLRRVIFNGNPSSDAVAVSRYVTLYDDQRLTGDPNAPTLENASYFMRDAPGPLYGVVEVEVVLWRT